MQQQIYDTENDSLHGDHWEGGSGVVSEGRTPDDQSRGSSSASGGDAHYGIRRMNDVYKARDQIRMDGSCVTSQELDP